MPFSRDLSPEEVIADSLVSEEHSAEASRPLPNTFSESALPIVVHKDEVEGQQSKSEKGPKKGKATKMKKSKSLESGTGTKVDKMAEASTGRLDDESQRPIATSTANRTNAEQKEGEGVILTSDAARRKDPAGGDPSDSKVGFSGSLIDVSSVVTITEWRAESEVLAWITSAPLSPRSQSRGSSLISFSIGAHTYYLYYHQYYHDYHYCYLHHWSHGQVMFHTINSRKSTSAEIIK